MGLIRAVNPGAEPFSAIDRRIRPVEYSPALRLDNAAARATKFMTDADTAPASGLPRWEKNVRNGDLPDL